MEEVVDVYPARLTGLGAERLDKVRVSIRDGLMRVWQGQDIRLVAEEPVSVVKRDGRGRRVPWQVVLADGRELEVLREGHCGCGDPLKRFNPRSWQG